MRHKGEDKMDSAGRDQLAQRIEQIAQRLAGVQARLPAHSIPPAMVMEIEALEEQLEQLQRELDERDE
jgi:hypothetical protein